MPRKRYRGFESPPLRIVFRKKPRSGSHQDLGGFRTREGASVSETVPLDCRVASGPSRAGRRGKDGSLRSKMRESPLSALESQESEYRSPVPGPGFRVFGRVRWQVGGRVGGSLTGSPAASSQLTQRDERARQGRAASRSSYARAHCLATETRSQTCITCMCHEGGTWE